LEPGHLTYGEYIIPGQTNDEVLISCHICHPSLCNDNLAGITVATMLARLLTSVPTRYTYRFVFIPGTIGSITWLATHEDVIPSIKHGFVLTCAGDPGDITYKRTRRGNAEIDQAMTHVLEHSGGGYRVLEFTPYGYDERQYCSPAFNLPVGVIMRSLHGTFPQYHTSADNLDLVQPTYLADTLTKCIELCRILESNRRYLNLFPKGEPQLGKRGIYKAISGQQHIGFDQIALLWVLNYSDGENSLLDIAERSGMHFAQIERAANLLAEHGLLEEISAPE
jgi:aminopeptidase-like protein